MTGLALVEVCVDSAAGVAAAIAGGAHRIELCSALDLDGLTPSAGLLAEAIDIAAGLVPVHVMIRPGPGLFRHDRAEHRVMANDIRVARATGAAGVVFGLVLPDGTVDVPLTRELVALADPLEVTFHRAFDHVQDPVAALDVLLGSGVSRVLTAGGAGGAMDGLGQLAALVAHAAGRIVVMPGGGIRPENAAAIREATGAREFHTSARVPDPLDASRKVTSASIVRAVIASLASSNAG